MKNEQNLSEDARLSHQKKKQTLKICGFLCLSVGIIFSLIGLIDFFRAFSSMSGAPTLFFFCFIGFPMIGAGAGMLSFGYRQEILRYSKNESVPVFNEAGKEIAPGVTDIAAAVSKGLNNPDSPHANRCSCGTLNEPGSKFCKSCGKPLTIACTHCGAEIPADSKFCNSCGTKL